MPFYLQVARFSWRVVTMVMKVIQPTMQVIMHIITQIRKKTRKRKTQIFLKKSSKLRMLFDRIRKSEWYENRRQRFYSDGIIERRTPARYTIERCGKNTGR